MQIELPNKKTIQIEKVVKILKEGQDYMIYLRKLPPYELPKAYYKWFLLINPCIVEVSDGIAINRDNIVSYDTDSVSLEDDSDIQLTPEKVELLKYSCLSLDCGEPEHEGHKKIMNLLDRVAFLEICKQDPKSDIDENNYKKI